MNDILQRIIEIENEAKQIMADIDTMKQEAPSVISKEKQMIEERMLKDTTEKISAFEKKEQQRCEAAVDLQRKEYEEKLQQLISHFGENRSKWIDEIYNRIISR